MLNNKTSCSKYLLRDGIPQITKGSGFTNLTYLPVLVVPRDSVISSTLDVKSNQIHSAKSSVKETLANVIGKIVFGQFNRGKGQALQQTV